VGFESLLERDFLVLADYNRDVAGFASQLFAVLWPEGMPATSPSRSKQQKTTFAK
jgi:hypothetical protein